MSVNGKVIVGSPLSVILPVTINDFDGVYLQEPVDMNGLSTGFVAIQHAADSGGGTLTSKIQESADTVTWFDLFSFAATTGGIEAIVGTRTRRYLRHSSQVSSDSIRISCAIIPIDPTECIHANATGFCVFRPASRS